MHDLYSSGRAVKEVNQFSMPRILWNILSRYNFLKYLWPALVKQYPGSLPSMSPKNFPMERMTLGGEFKLASRFKNPWITFCQFFRSIPRDTDLLTLIYTYSRHDRVTCRYRLLMAVMAQLQRKIYSDDQRKCILEIMVLN